MKFFAALALLVASSQAYAQEAQNYFPLKQGNTWTYGQANGEQLDYLTIDSSCAGMHYVTGIPGAQSGLWVAWSGNTLYAWRPSTSKWVAFLRLGAPIGTYYNVTLDYPFYQNTQLLIKGKSFSSYDPFLDKTYTNCIHVAFPGDLSEGSPTEMIFAKNVGLVQYGIRTTEGQNNFHVYAATLNGKNYGRAPHQTIESGNYSQYPVVGKNKLLVITNQAAWEAFYAQHNPGAEVPKADFVKQTVVVVLAGQRNTSGYWLESPRVTWNYPLKSTTVSVVEHTPAGPVLMVLTRPFAILLVDGKFSQATADWQVIYNK